MCMNDIKNVGYISNISINKPFYLNDNSIIELFLTVTWVYLPLFQAGYGLGYVPRAGRPPWTPPGPSNKKSPHPLMVAGSVPSVINYDCTYCGRRFKRADNLRDHVRTHTGEKPFRCQVCSYSASHKSNLNAHTKKLHPELS